MDHLEIAIDSPQRGVYPVRTTTAAGEQATGTLVLPQTDAVWEAMLAKLASRDRATVFSEDEVIALGQRLYDLLFQGPTASLFQSATSQAALAKHPLQIQLQLASYPELVPVAALPWEFMTDREGHPLVTRYSLVRSLPHSSPIPPLTVNGPVTMLLAWALPTELGANDPLNIAAEVQAIQAQLQPLIAAGQLTLHILDHATPLSLNRMVQDHQPHLLHMLGHGQPAMSGAPQLVLETDEGAIQLLSPKQLGIALQGSPVRLVVLNACHSGVHGTALFQAFGPALLTNGVSAVVGMQASVLDRAGRIFATELYRTLVKTRSVDQAVQQGRKALILTDISQVDWGLATLYLRARDGHLFAEQVPMEHPVSIVADATMTALFRLRAIPPGTPTRVVYVSSQRYGTVHPFVVPARILISVLLDDLTRYFKLPTQTIGDSFGMGLQYAYQLVTVKEQRPLNPQSTLADCELPDDAELHIYGTLAVQHISLGITKPIAQVVHHAARGWSGVSDTHVWMHGNYQYRLGMDVADRDPLFTNGELLLDPLITIPAFRKNVTLVQDYLRPQRFTGMPSVADDRYGLGMRFLDLLPKDE